MTTNQLFEITEGLVFVVLMEDEPIHQIDPITGAISRCRDSSCPCQDDNADGMEQEDADTMAASEAWLARQAAQHEEDKHYFSMWGLHEDPEDWTPPYGRADAEGDLATAAYYDELARRR